MTKHWILVDPEGRHHQTSCDNGKRPRVPKGHRLIEVPRRSLDPHCERWDEERGEWVLDAEKRRQMDAEIEFMMRPEHEHRKLAWDRITALEARVAELERKTK